ncbi:hypothetical protein BH11PLA2_BH11PLA2_04370 [soil metagenome]
MRCLVISCLIVTVGCTKDEPIRVYTAPKPVENNYCILGAMFPADEPQWFFKITGKEEGLAPHIADFDKFLASVRFPNGKQNAPLYDLPAGWTSLGASTDGITLEKIAFGSDDKKFTLTISPAKGGLDANLKRWFDQLGEQFSADAKAKATKLIGTPPVGLRVAITGPKNPAAGRGMMPGPR